MLPLVLLLAYCSGPNNTQTTQSTDNTGTSIASTSTPDAATVNGETAGTDITDTEKTVTTSNPGIIDSTSGTTTDMGTNNQDYTYQSQANEAVDTTDPKLAHWQKQNAGNWIYDYSNRNNTNRYSGNLNPAINGSWQMIMTPELAGLWRNEDRSQIYAGMYPSLNGNNLASGSQLMEGDTFISASESFNNNNVGNNSSNSSGNNLNSDSNLNNNNVGDNNDDDIANPSISADTATGGSENLNDSGTVQNSGTVDINGSTNAGTVSSNNASSSTHPQNNNASANAAAANSVNGSTSGSVNTGSSTMNDSGSVNGGISAPPNTNSDINGSVPINSSVNGNTNTTSTAGSSTIYDSVSGSISAGTEETVGTGTNDSAGIATTPNFNASDSLSGATNSLAIENVDYTAANGNYYQMPRFSLYIDNGSFVGFTGCNTIAGRLYVTGNTLHFIDTHPQTQIECAAGFSEQALLDVLKKVDSYQYSNDELQLLQGSQIVMRFKRTGQPTATTNTSIPSQQ